MARIKKALVKRSDYSAIVVHADLLAYIAACIATGSVATMFMNPHITTLFYGAGTTAKTALFDAMEVYKASPTTPNLETVQDKMILVIIWLDGFSDQVETISNDPANRTSREEAVTNITHSYLTPQSIVRVPKTKPLKPTFTAAPHGAGGIKVDLSKGFAETKVTVYVAVELPVGLVTPIPPPVVTVVEGQLSVDCSVPVHVATLTLTGKGTTAIFKNLKTGISYNIYCYTLNGKLLVSDLSLPVLVKM